MLINKLLKFEGEPSGGGDPKPPDPPPTPKPPDPPAPPETGHPKTDPDRADKQAHFFFNNPDKLQDLLDRVNEKSGGQLFKEANAGADELRADVVNLQLDNARKDAALKHGLTLEDANALQGTTPDEIAAQADYWAPKLKADKDVKPEGDKDKLPEGQTIADLAAGKDKPPVELPTYKDTGTVEILKQKGVDTPAVNAAYADMQESMGVHGSPTPKSE